MWTGGIAPAFGRLVLFGVGVVFVLGGCGGTPEDPARADRTYGTPITVTTGVPVPAVVAEESLYVNRALAVDGRIATVHESGCALVLEGGEASLRVRAGTRGDGSCAWTIPAETDGFAIAAGTLRTANDTLTLVANGVRVTPVRVSQGSP